MTVGKLSAAHLFQKSGQITSKLYQVTL